MSDALILDNGHVSRHHEVMWLKESVFIGVNKNRTV